MREQRDVYKRQGLSCSKLKAFFFMYLFLFFYLIYNCFLPFSFILLFLQDMSVLQILTILSKLFLSLKSFFAFLILLLPIIFRHRYSTRIMQRRQKQMYHLHDLVTTYGRKLSEEKTQVGLMSRLQRGGTNENSSKIQTPGTSYLL